MALRKIVLWQTTARQRLWSTIWHRAQSADAIASPNTLLLPPASAQSRIRDAHLMRRRSRSQTRLETAELGMVAFCAVTCFGSCGVCFPPPRVTRLA
eukprot:5316111-Prymnesium_polylepis.1